MIQGPRFSHNIPRIQAIDPDRQEDDQREGRGKRVLHQGREWTEAEEDDLSMHASIPTNTPSIPATDLPASTGVYADKALLERARRFFNRLTTLEEKAAQLCFFATDAKYDATTQHHIELLVQTWQFGGILFHLGEYRREAFLVERYQEVSKTPLLFANDYLHGLSFYLQGSTFSKSLLTEQHYSDLGKAVMVQNRRLGVHIQFDRERGNGQSHMSEAQITAFRKGVRGAHGVVGKEKQSAEFAPQKSKGNFPFLSFKDGNFVSPQFSEFHVQETIGVKTLTFFDATLTEKQDLEKAILDGIVKSCDVFLLGENLTDAIRTICALVRSGRVREETLDRHVMKVLILKSLFFK